MRRRTHGYVLIEAITGTVLLTTAATLTVQAVATSRAASLRYDGQRMAAWAAASQLQRYHAGAPFDSLPPAALFDADLQLTTNVEPGQGEWADFHRVTVTATLLPHAGHPV